MSLWAAADAASATGGRATTDWACDGLSIDTRTIQKGDLFVALTAARDGHDFVAQALDKGAGAALVSRIPEGLDTTAPLLIVPDVQAALEDLGRAGRARMTGKVIAVTGSVGKTSTKEMLRAALSGQGKTHASVASYNNHWGVPLTLARMPADSRFAVIEIGMNHPGEIAPLAQMARPHVAIVTNVGAAHMEAFGSLAGIAAEKAAICDGLEPGGVAVLNGDLEVSPILFDAARARGAKIVSFGERPGNHHRLVSVRLVDQTTVAEARAWRTPVLYKVQAAGRHFAVNALAVVAMAQVLHLDRALLLADLGQWVPVAGRGAREKIQMDPVETSQCLELIDDSYNANPVSMAASLEVLAAAEVTNDIGRVGQGRRIAYLGDMKELGSDAVALHARLAALEATRKIDRIHAVGPLMKALHDALPREKRGRWCETAREMAAGLRSDLDAGDVVLVKGSLSTGLAAVVDAIRKLGQGPRQTGPGDD
ncbi:UDP-N-acetylmuramoyl-tripeptide--D-alanyl-D-alanine ligase [Mesobacterium pallidum]|uniref:UDP-N-acetylmuramoyl-tripeptide--D-alanyl-D- alanine ligase n=1 Tax=Mesobacterium pallidum TaxID=2872037 RepID=UPI001EE1C30D|nr:UDP-N-acetylmuramoyl-tripeptide--D-alanyl-D-alanine ligase [Mesobacterium pallidum]